MQTLKQSGAEWSLRLSLGIMYLYSGIDLFLHPTAWFWAIPTWLKDIIGTWIAVDTYIRLQGIVEIILAVVLLAWFLPRKAVLWAALISAIEFAAILLLAFAPWNAQNFSITFRDIGILGASLALYFLLLKSTNNNGLPSQPQV